MYGGITDDLTINLVSSEDRPEVTNASGTSTVNWSGDVVDKAAGGWGDDTIYGNDAANYIYAGAVFVTAVGDDTVFAGGGDDTIWVTDLDENTRGDRVDCGEGNDTVRYDRGDVVKNCEVKLRSESRSR